MCRTPSKLLIGKAVVSSPIDHATPGFSHPLFVVTVLKTNSGVLRGAKAARMAITTMKKVTWSMPPRFSAKLITLRNAKFSITGRTMNAISKRVACHRFGSYVGALNAIKPNTALDRRDRLPAALQIQAKTVIHPKAESELYGNQQLQIRYHTLHEAPELR